MSPPSAMLLLAAVASLHLALCAHDEYENRGVYPQKAHSLLKPYQGSGMTIPNWDFIGYTMVSANFIRLTPDQQSRIGGVWNKHPLMFPNWEVHMQFKIHGHGKNLFGDGMAFWYVKHPMQAGKVFGSADYFWGLAVFLDTYANQNGAHSHVHPYISATVNNATLEYDHDRDGTHTQLAGCESKFRGVEHDTSLAVRYQDDVLSVLMDVDGTGEWAECFRAEDVFLPTGLYLGVTAATGDLSDNHDLISIKTFMLEASEKTLQQQRHLIIPHARLSELPREHVADSQPGRSWLKTIVYFFFGLLLLAVVAFLAYLYYQRNQRDSRKRFY